MKIKIIFLAIFYSLIAQASCIISPLERSELSYIFEHDESKTLHQVITQVANQNHTTNQDYLHSSLRLSKKMTDSGYKNESIYYCSCQEETNCINLGLVADACLKPCLPTTAAQVRYNCTLLAAEKYSSHQKFYHQSLLNRNSLTAEYGQYFDITDPRL